MARFFIAGTNFPNGRAIIRGRDADHLRVLRLRAGDDIVICDGAGRDYKCRLIQTLEHEAEAEVIEVVPCKAEPTVRSTVFAGLPKGGAQRLSRAEVHGGGRVRDRVFLLHALCGQGRQYGKRSSSAGSASPRRRPSSPAAASSRRCAMRRTSSLCSTTHCKPICRCSCTRPASARRSATRSSTRRPPIASAAIITGPEGGFAEFEVDMARKLGMHICSMGERILRCETAPVVALTALMYGTGNL